jgi:nicotinamidase-related amidase
MKAHISSRAAMLIDPEDSTLILIDFQAKLMPAIHEGDVVMANAMRLAKAAQMLRVPCFATEQNPEKLGLFPAELRALCKPILSKMAFSGADDLIDAMQPAIAPPAPLPQKGSARSVPAHLRKAPEEAPQRGTLVLAGCEAHVCLLQTALELIETEEFLVTIVTDACGSRTERNRDAAFDRLASAGAELVTTEMVLFEWLVSCEHPLFREVQALIK